MTVNIDGSYSVNREMAVVASNTETAAGTTTPKAGGKTAAGYYNQLCDAFSNLKISQGRYTPGTVAGSGTGNVMIDPRYLEKAANDSAVAAELEKNLSDIPAAENWFKSMCALSGREVVAGGVVIDENGGMSSWSVTRTTGQEDDDKKTEDGTEKKAREKTLVEVLTEYREKQSEKAEEADGDDKSRCMRRQLIEMYFENLAEGSGLSLFNWRA